MKAPSALICMLARDCKAQFLHNIPIIQDYCAGFSDWKLIVVENGSTDGTAELIEEWRGKSGRITVLHPSDADFSGLRRIEKMVCLRNLYLNEAQRQGDFDYLIVIDGDIELIPADLQKIISNAPEDWAGLFSNGQYYGQIGRFRFAAGYYDLYAFVSETAEDEYLTHSQVMNNLKAFTSVAAKRRFIPCRSAFGGMAVYKAAAISGAEYRTAINPNNPGTCDGLLCEHIAYNKKISEAGKLYVCRNLPQFYERLPLRTCAKLWISAHFGWESALKLSRAFRRFRKRWC